MNIIRSAGASLDIEKIEIGEKVYLLDGQRGYTLAQGR
jgi:hypothetical protein